MSAANSTRRPDPRIRRVIREVFAAVEDVLQAADRLRRANAKLSKEATRPDLKVTPTQDATDGQ